MSPLHFQANTQYGDWKGTAAADEHGGGDTSIEELFEATGHVNKDNEILIGLEFYASEGFFFLRGYYHPKSQGSDVGGWIPTLNRDFQKEHGPIRVKSLKVEITRDEFFKYFKRFSVVLVERNLDIIGREYEIVEES
jgi:hypothetical protein